MSDIVVHIGTHKTASTTIQDTLAHNRSDLARAGLVFPQIGAMNGQHLLSSHWVARKGIFGGDDTPPGELWRGLAHGYGERPGTVLLSSEEFSRARPLRVNFAELRDFVAPFAKKTLVCLLRNQVSFVQSLYLEIARTRSVGAFPAYLEECLETNFAVGIFLNYLELYWNLRRGFKDVEIVLLSYEAGARSPDGMTAFVLRSLGLDAAAAALKPLPNGDSHISPDPLALWVAHRIAAPEVPSPQQIAHADRAIAAFCAAEGRVRGKSSLYSRDEIATVAARFDALNRPFIEKVGQPRNLTLAFEPLPENTLYRSDLGDTFWRRFAPDAVAERSILSRLFGRP